MILLSVCKILLLSLLLALVVYALFTLVGMIFPVNRNFISLTDGIDIFVGTNGMHTDFIVPVKNSLFDWTQFIDKTDFDVNLLDNAHIGIGWGDKAIYLDLPDWSQLTFKLGAKTLLLPTPTLLHITAYKQLPIEALNTSHLRISTSQYLQLCHYILGFFQVDEIRRISSIKDAGYTSNDNFYPAQGKYHAFFTCNTWVNKGFKRIGVRTPLWTPIDKGIFHQLKKIPSLSKEKLNFMHLDKMTQSL